MTPMQMRILAVLLTDRQWMTRKQIGERTRSAITKDTKGYAVNLRELEECGYVETDRSAKELLHRITPKGVQATRAW